ncbi:hypothetical protein AB0G02_40675, partial [Actinosynnema sp. NPDC023658]
MTRSWCDPGAGDDTRSRSPEEERPWRRTRQRSVPAAGGASAKYVESAFNGAMWGLMGIAVVVGA